MPISAFSDKKYLVVMTKDGGEDNYATLISRQPDHVSASCAARPSLAFTQEELNGPYASVRLSGSQFSLHPALQPLVSIWDAGEMAITHRVGTMFTDLANVPIDEVRRATNVSYTGSVLMPFGISAHDRQAFSSVSMITRDYTDSSGRARVVAESGMLGRLAERFEGFAGSSSLPMSILCGLVDASGTLLTSDGMTRGLTIPTAGFTFRRNLTGAPTQEAALRRLDAVMAELRSERRTEAFRRVNLVANAGVAFLQPVIEGGVGTFTVDQSFPGDIVGGWRGILRTYARVIEADVRRPTLQNRVILIGSMSGYDTHAAQGKMTGRLPGLHADWATGVACFRDAMIRLGVWNNTLMLDHSEFGRSLRENGANGGTDHGYARDAFAFGGAVRGKGRDGSTGLFGQYPSVLSASGNGTFDLIGGLAGGGALAPGISMEQYWDEPLRWFGADAADIADALPRRSAFGASVNLIA
ncbi:MAG: DUF1501 domain-containing protein [Pseudomonadota bacterium]